MAIGHLTPEELRAMREHGHIDYWEVAVRKNDGKLHSIDVVCNECDAVLIELVNTRTEAVPKCWIVLYTHRHGTDTWPLFRVDAPDVQEIIEDLNDVWGDSDFDPDRGDSVEIVGPFDVPKEFACTG